jgi:hypothetical protein
MHRERHPAGGCVVNPTLQQAVEVIKDLIENTTFPAYAGESCRVCPTATDGGCRDEHDPDCSYQMAIDKAEAFVKRVAVEPVTKELKEHPSRESGGIVCCCGGYAGRVKCTKDEIERFGCHTGGECCARAFLCAVCGLRWVGQAEAPEMDF